MKHTIIALVVALAISSGGLLYGVYGLMPSDAVIERADRMKGFCVGVKVAMIDDRYDFRRGDAKERALALDRFYVGHVMYHNADSIRFCLDDVPPMPWPCWLNKHWPCLTDYANRILERL